MQDIVYKLLPRIERGWLKELFSDVTVDVTALSHLTCRKVTMLVYVTGGSRILTVDVRFGGVDEVIILTCY